MIPKFTIADFRNKYSTDQACLDKIFQLRYGKLEACPQCACPTSFRRITTRRAYQCKHCYAQFYPTAGTVFEKTTIPLSDWFYVIALFTYTRNGVSAKEIQRQIGCTYKTAWRMGHQIRKLIGGISEEKLKGFVELDETYYGGTSEHSGRSVKDKTPVFGIVQRDGQAKAFKVDNVQKETLYPIIKKHVDLSATLNTDEFKTYVNLVPELGFKEHNTINHGMKIYRIGSASTNTAEGYFSHLKRMLYGTHIHVSAKYLQNYVNEHNFRFNMRKHQDIMFDSIIFNLPEVKNEPNEK